MASCHETAVDTEHGYVRCVHAECPCAGSEDFARRKWYENSYGNDIYDPADADVIVGIQKKLGQVLMLCMLPLWMTVHL